VAQRIEELTPTDGAQVLQKLPRELSADVRNISIEYRGKCFVGDGSSPGGRVIARMEPPEASMVLSAMEPDDRVDILEHISGPLHDQLLGEMTAAEAAETRDLEHIHPTARAES